MPGFAYPARFERDVDGRVLVTFRDFDGAATDGADDREAMSEAVDLLESLLGEARHDGAPPPTPSLARPGDRMIAPSAATQLQLELMAAMARADVRVAELAHRLGRSVAHVESLLVLENSPLLHDLEAALAALGRRIVLIGEDVA